MARVSANNNVDEFRIHTVSVRYRVYGTGNLRTTLFSYQDVNSSTLPVIPMSATTDRFASILANFESQKTQLRFQTTGHGETFVIAKIITFAKPTSAGYPQT